MREREREREGEGESVRRVREEEKMGKRVANFLFCL
jgi:hypothetical protein